jgi:peptide/nickel transport system substrate-binding protein
LLSVKTINCLRASTAAVLVAVSGVCLVGCGRNPGSQPVQGTLRIGAALPTNAPAGSGLRALTGLLINETLLTTNFDGRPSPRLASDWQWDESRTKLTVRLRQNVYFHDGTELTAPIAAEVLKKSIADQETPSFSSISEVTAKGRYELEVRLSRPDAFVIADLPGTAIVKPGTTEVGTGPFKIVATKPNIRLQAFDKYYRGRPSVEEIEIEGYPSLRKAWASMMRGDIDMLHGVSRDAVDFVQAETTVHTYSFPRPYYVPLVFNVRHAVLRRADVRQALSEAINKDAAVRDGLRSRGTPAESPIWPQHWANAVEFHGLTFNPESARARLEAAGLPIQKPAEGGMPKRFSFTCLLFAEDTRFERMALVIQKQLFDIGVDMKLESVALRTLVPRLQKGDFDAFLFEFTSARTLSWTYYAWHSGVNPLFNSGYSGADAVLDRLRYASSDEDTRALTAELLEVFKNDPPAVFIAWQEQTRAVATRFEVPDEPGRDIMGSVWQWRVKPTTVLQASR